MWFNGKSRMAECQDVVDLLYNFRFVVQLVVQQIHNKSK